MASADSLIESRLDSVPLQSVISSAAVPEGFYRNRKRAGRQADFAMLQSLSQSDESAAERKWHCLSAVLHYVETCVYLKK
jgi:hypothetical protein